MISGKETDNRAKQEAPRDFKHLAIHVLVQRGLLVFNNIAAKDTVDLIVGIPKNGELRTAGIRIKTSSLQKREGRRFPYFYFSEDDAEYAVLKTPFFYVFCLEKKKTTEDTLIAEPTFIVISTSDLAKKTKSFNNGNYGVDISENQLSPKSKRSWAKFIKNFDQIKKALEDAS